MNKNILIIGLLVVLFIVGGFLYVNSQTGNSTTKLQNMNDVDNINVNQNPMPITGSSEESEVKEFTITGSNFTFDVPSISVNKGDRVKITFTNSEGTHNLTIDGLNVNTKTISAEKQDTIEFTANKQGMFEFYCSVGNHRQQGMIGMLMVN